MTSKAFADEAFTHGVQLYKAKQYAEAVSSFEQSQNKSDPILHYYLGNSLGSLNRTKEALAEYTTCSLLHPDPQTSDLCNQALRRYADLPQSASTPVAAANDPTKGTSVSGSHKPSALDWANDSDTPAPHSTSQRPVKTDSVRQSFDQRVQDQLATEKAQLEAQRAKSKQALERATQEATEIKRDAHTQTENLNTYGHKGGYDRDQAIEEIKEDADARSKDVIERGKTESRLYAKSAEEKQRALDSAVRNLHAQMRGGQGKVRLDPTDSNLYVRNYKSH